MSKSNESTSWWVPVAIVLAMVLLIGGGTVAGAFLLKWAWNLVAVDVFHAPSITAWHAFAALVLLALLGGVFRSSTSKG